MALPRISPKTDLAESKTTPKSTGGISLPLAVDYKGVPKWRLPKAGRFPLRIQSSPNLQNQPGQIPDHKKTNKKLTSPFSPQASTRFRNLLLTDKMSTHKIHGRGVITWISRLKSLVSKRSPMRLNEHLLNEFNMEVGIVSSRIDMWRYRLENEQLHSNENLVPSDVSSPDVPSTYWALIYAEVQHLVQLTISMITSLFDGMLWLLSELEKSLLMLFQLGSSVVFPMFDDMVVNIWRYLIAFLDLRRDDWEKTFGLGLVLDSISNAFFAIRSLLHLGYAYRNIHGITDSVYTGDDSRSQVDRQPAGNIVNDFESGSGTGCYF